MYVEVIYLWRALPFCSMAVKQQLLDQLSAPLPTEAQPVHQALRAWLKGGVLNTMGKPIEAEKVSGLLCACLPHCPLLLPPLLLLPLLLSPSPLLLPPLPSYPPPPSLPPSPLICLCPCRVSTKLFVTILSSGTISTSFPFLSMSWPPSRSTGGRYVVVAYGGGMLYYNI